MGPLSIFALTSFFSEEENSIKKGENHWKSGHVNYFAYSPGVLRGEIDASMKKKSHKGELRFLAVYVIKSVDLRLHS